MDIEGAEKRALTGGMGVLKRDRPLLAIAIYHSLEDIVEIPQLLMQQLTDYHFIVRSHSNTYSEAVFIWSSCRIRDSVRLVYLEILKRLKRGRVCMIKNIKATMPVMPEYESYIQEIKSIWENGIMTNNGEKVKKLRDMLAEYLACPNIDLFVNGHSALLLAIKLMDLEGEVITSPFTFCFNNECNYSKWINAGVWGY